MTEREKILIDALISAGHISKQARTVIEKLKAENAELRARLEKAVELPTIYEHTIYPFIENLYTETIYYVIYKENGKIIAINCGKNKATSEARLAELKGEEKNG